MKTETKREQLLTAVRDSRRGLQQGLVETRRAVDLTGRVEASMRKNIFWWIGGSVLAGVLIASGTRHNGQDDHGLEKKSGSDISVNTFRRLLFKMLKGLFNFSGPILKSMVTREIIQAISERSSGKQGPG